MQDTYWPEPRAAYQERRRLYLNYCSAQTPDNRLGFMSQIACLELGQDVDEGSIREGIAFVNSRHDCCDFAAGGRLIELLLDIEPRGRFGHANTGLTCLIENGDGGFSARFINRL